jgi:acetyl esterase/lipase
MISEHDRQFLARLPVWNPAGDIAAQRRAWEELAKVFNHDLPSIGRLEENVELRPGLRADVAVPKGAGPHSVVIYLHGGGWAFGSPASFRKLGMQFAEAGYLTIILDYRLAPEHPFPAALEDSIFAIRWASDNAPRWNGDGGRIAIGGDSAGGNLAMSAITSNAPELRAPVRAALLFYGGFVRRSTRQSAQSGGAGTASAVLHHGCGQRLLVSRRLAGACASALGRREPLRAARDGRNAARVHADERARGVPRGHALDVGVPGAQRLSEPTPPLRQLTAW